MKICGKVKKVKKTGQNSKFFIYSLYMSTTYQPKKKKRATTHGFLVRSKTKGGQKMIKRRRQKGRSKLAV